MCLRCMLLIVLLCHAFQAYDDMCHLWPLVKRLAAKGNPTAQKLVDNTTPVVDRPVHMCSLTCILNLCTVCAPDFIDMAANDDLLKVPCEESCVSTLQNRLQPRLSRVHRECQYRSV